MPNRRSHPLVHPRRAPSNDASAASAHHSSDITNEAALSAVRRVRVAALISGTIWTAALAANVVFSPWWIAMDLPGTAGWPHPNWIYAAAGAAGSFALAYAVKRVHSAPTRVLDIGLGLEVFTAALISLISFYEISPHAGRISWVTAVILVYPAIAPAAPRRILVAGLLAASTDAGAFGLALLRGETIPGSDGQVAGTLVWMLVPNYLCALLALVPATLIRRLGHEVGAARELGSYRLGRLLDRGGMGEVYEATHRMIAKPAAIKLIRPELLTNTPEFAEMVVERFYREAEAVAQLRSPHTVALYDFGVAADGTLYYVMELLEGIDLQRLVERHGPLPAERVAHILAQACESLGEAHARGMVHRDIKPSNIVVCRLGLVVDFVKVLDFGLVRQEAPASQSVAGISAPLGPPGTPSYMAPEYVRGSGTVDRRADLYALGCVGYWLLTGHTVFEGESPVQIMYHHGYDPPIRPSDRLGRAVPGDLESVILDALAKQPSERPSTAAEFGRRVRECLRDRPWTLASAAEWWAEHQDGGASPVVSSPAINVG